MNLTPDPPVIVLLDKTAHYYANLFAAQQVTLAKGKQVYLNTLAVCAVQTYLSWFDVPTDLAQSDCWQPELRAIFNIADLVLPQVGKLECRPVLPRENKLVIPSEATENRIGYLVVQFKENLGRAELVGFLPACCEENPDTIGLCELQPLDVLFDVIAQQKLCVNLQQWWQGIFQPEWQPTETLLATRGTAHRTVLEALEVKPPDAESCISRAKVLTWKREGIEWKVILVLKAISRLPKGIEICLEILPFREGDYLPSNLEVTVLDESGILPLGVQTRTTGNELELGFCCFAQAKFRIKLTLDDMSMTEQFVA